MVDVMRTHPMLIIGGILHITDLLSVLALPAIWSGHASVQIADTLLDVLVRLLRLDFAYIRLRDARDGLPIELVRVAQPRCPAVQPCTVSQALNRWVTTEPYPAPCVITNPVGPGEVSIVCFRLGLEDDVGVVVAGAQRADFHTSVEWLLGGVAVNQAAIGLQEARRIRDQQRAAADLEQQVVEALLCHDVYFSSRVSETLRDALLRALAEEVSSTAPAILTERERDATARRRQEQQVGRRSQS